MNVALFTIFSLALGVAEAPADGTPADDAPAWPEPVELAPVEMPRSVDAALGVEGASALRKAGIASLVTGGLLGVLSASAFSLGFESERVLRAEPHTRAQADALLFERSIAAAIAYPSLVLGAAGVAAGVACLIWDDGAPGLSDGNEEVTP